ncbi:M48 family metallopeptidase [Hymenobacter sp. BT18]|uniref:M48 family metallopeptidase n=1 Tax=Hymenobacter sp. BT18 TaxID=2835648 RepID=UPI00143E2D6F|nr:SprT family zinc-dependent metalloprotease [Hymenobacter sp. BT18]QIX63035.1 M48 family metallopeptidase [Hymenobacter sp. BT18]
MALTQLAGIEVDLVRKRMRSLRLTVYAAGRVRVSAPLHTPLAAVEEFVRTRRAWIEKHQQQFAARTPAPQLQFEAGETHFYQGQAYTLAVHPADRPRVELHPETRELHLYVPAEATPEQRAALLTAWYRQQLRALMPQLLAKWEPVVGRQAASWGIRQMRTRWGTCNIGARRIWLNLELMKRPLLCLEYVVVHELNHLHERLHNARFWGLMDQFMPDWRDYKAELNRIHLTPGAPPDAD